MTQNTSRVSIIVAYDENRAIGVRGGIPWNIPTDLKRFKSLTSGHPVIMGRATHESIGRALPRRLNIVLTTQTSYEPYEGAVCVQTFAEAMSIAQQAAGGNEIFVIGGEKVYREALSSADRIYATEVSGVHPGEVYFPEINRHEWQKHPESSYEAEGDMPAHRYVRYEHI